MHSKRAIEDLSIDQITSNLKERYNINNTIINNASIETNEIKQRYGEKLFSFFNIFLTATLISNFILYENNSNLFPFYSKEKTFLFVLLLTCFVLAIYTYAVFIKFHTQYLRQKIYRDINNLITIIINDCKTFFCGCHVSVETLNSFFEVMYLSCKTKNKSSSYKVIMTKEWIGIVVSFLCILMCFFSSIILIFLR